MRAAFLLVEARLRRLDEVLRKTLQEVGISTDLVFLVSFSNGQIEEFQAVDGILKLTNGGDRTINAISISTAEDSATQVGVIVAVRHMLESIIIMLFPVGVFALGEGEARYKRFRSGSLVAFATALIGLIGAVISLLAALWS